MRRFFVLFFSVLLLSASSVFVSFTYPSANVKTNPIVYKLMEVTFLWDLLKENYEPVRERDDTWLDVGIRSKYAMVKQYASLAMVEAAFDCPIFIRGPHNGELNFNDKTSFGYYNPEFVSKLQSNMESALENPMFKQAAKQLYQQHLKSMAHTYLNAYTHLHEDGEYLHDLQVQYLMGMATPEGIQTGSFQEEFRDYAEALEKNQQADVYEAFTAPAFWLRRSIDGTAPQLFELLEMVVKEMEK
ncbi:MAG: hypothetical protein R3E32_15035 [Chitinophagales bacterium]